MIATKLKKQKRDRRHARIRAKVSGTSSRPRLSVFKSSRYLSAQLIDDVSGTTLAAISTRGRTEKAGKDRARAAGVELASRAKEKKISEVVFDRGGFIYTGIIQAFAEGAREGGLVF